MASLMVCKVMGEPAKIKLLLKVVIPRYITNTPASLKNLVLKVSPKMVVTNPKPKKSGAVPKIKTPMIAAPRNGLPDEMAKASMAKVVPQGIKIVKAPKIAGAKISLLLDASLIFRVKKRGGWMMA